MKPADLFAVVSPGLEEVALAEAKELGLLGARPIPGGFVFEGDLEAGMRACLWLRVATTVRMRLASFMAKDRRALEKGLFAVDLKSWLPQGKPVAISSTSSKSRLGHTGMLADAVRRAAGRDARKGTGGLHLRMHRDRADLSIDLAGERLHVRGWRREGGAAPLRETLAAGILRLAEYRGEEPFLDPMCGSGTIPIEAALMAARVAPGLGRSFAFEEMPRFESRLWGEMIDEARAGIIGEPLVPIRGSDRNGGAVGSAKRNAERAGIGGFLRIDRLDIADLEPLEGIDTGLLVVNPPYGVRIGSSRSEVEELYTRLGRTILERFARWRVFVLTPERALVEATGLRLEERASLDNGGIRTRLFGPTSES